MAVDKLPFDLLPHQKPWDRLPDEPIRWYARFEHYRLLGPLNRTVSQVQAEEYAIRDGALPSRTRASSNWYTQARRWHWQVRAEAWDESQLEQKADEVEKALQYLRESLPKAAIRLIELLDSDKEAQVRLAAKDIFKLMGIAQLARPDQESFGRPLEITLIDPASLLEPDED